jgi:prepilin-type N-terminal cleavage/methylation domain-containing protein
MMKNQAGFSLVELAIVILIMGLIIGGLAMPLSVQLENGRIKETRDLLVDAESAVQGYALANGHLPCPATPGSNGLSAVSGGGCSVQHGFFPAATLGISGARNDDNLLLDSWANPLRYSVSASDIDGDGNWDFTAPGEMRDVTMPLLSPDLVICATATGASAVACADPSVTLTAGAPLVLFSMGKDWGAFSGQDQQENVGANLGGGPTGVTYPVPADRVSVHRRRSDEPGNGFDDLVHWSASATLFQRLVAGGQLP